MDILNKNQIMVLVGETGSGKTTQVMKTTLRTHVSVIKNLFYVRLKKKSLPYFSTDPTMVSRMGQSTVCQERGGVYTAQEGGSHVSCPACSRGAGRRSGTGSWLQHSI